MGMPIPGYAGKILRVDLSKGHTSTEDLDEATLKKWVGGVGLGAKYLYDEVPPGVEWADPENRLIWTSGPLAGSGVSGAATFNVITRGPMTNLAGSSQANGFFGAYLKFSGFDGIIFQGAAPRLVYLWIHDGGAEIRDARHLAGKDVWQVENIIREELGAKERDVSFGVFAAQALQEGRIDGFWANAMGAETAVTSGIGKIHVDVRRGDDPGDVRFSTFAGLATTDDYLAREPDAIDAAVRAIVKAQKALRDDPALAREVGDRKFPPESAAQIAAIVERDAAFYDPAISEEAVQRLNSFAQSVGQLSGPVAYEQVVATRCRPLWTAG